VNEGFHVVYRDEVRFEGTDMYGVWNQGEEAQKMQIAMDSYLTSWLLSECDFYIGTFGSNLARGAFEMLIAKKGQDTIAVGVDYPWNERVLK
jgi:hypothetical protein